MVFAASHGTAYAITNQQGQPCAGNAVATSANGGAHDDGSNLICISGTWQYPFYVFGSAAASAGSSCTGYPAGAVRYNTTLTNMEFCDGTNWNFMAASTASCGSPSGLSFTNLTSQSLNTSVTSNTATITISGCAGGSSVSVSGAATAQISVNGGAWVTSGSISSGQTLQVRMTTSGSVSTTLTATVTVGGSSTNWTTTTRAGSLEVFATEAGYIGSGIGGLSGADAICQSEANAASLAGTYKAIMSDDTTSAASRLTLSYPIVDHHSGNTVAGANLWVGSISAPITSVVNGYVYGGGYDPSFVWSGTNPDGSIGTYTCSSWTGGGGTAMAGIPGYANSNWIAWSYWAPCSGTYGILCIQQ